MTDLALSKPNGRLLLLDVDGVLVTPPEMFGVRLLRSHPEVATEFFYGPFMAASRGEVDLLDVLPPYLERLGYTKTAGDFLNEWFESENHPNRSMLSALRELRGLGWPTYLATNQERYRVQYLLNDMRLGELVDGEFSSASIGTRKPEVAYFAEVTRRLAVSPERVVFWDDAQTNVDAARQAGWTAYLFTDVDGFRTVMGLA